MKVAICTPTYDGRIQTRTSRAIRALTKRLEARGDKVAEADVSRSANLPQGRNALTATALAWGADAILWVDSDIAFTVEDALKLIDRPEEIVGAAPQRRPKALGEPAEVAWQPHTPGEVRIKGDLLDVRVAPTAFLKTSASVFAKLAESGKAKRLYRPPKWMTFPPEALALYRNYFWYELVDIGERDPETGETLWREDEEDTSFCRRAIEAGVSCYLDPCMRLVHHAHGVECNACLWDIIGPEVEASLKQQRGAA